MTERQTQNQGISVQAQQIIDGFKAIDQQKGINGNTYRVERTANGVEVVVKDKPNGEEVHIPVRSG